MARSAPSTWTAQLLWHTRNTQVCWGWALMISASTSAVSGRARASLFFSWASSSSSGKLPMNTLVQGVSRVRMEMSRPAQGRRASSWACSRSTSASPSMTRFSRAAIWEAALAACPAFLAVSSTCWGVMGVRPRKIWGSCRGGGAYLSSTAADWSSSWAFFSKVALAAVVSVFENSSSASWGEWTSTTPLRWRSSSILLRSLFRA